MVESRRIAATSGGNFSKGNFLLIKILSLLHVEGTRLAEILSLDEIAIIYAGGGFSETVLRKRGHFKYLRARI